jgi:hypothetical protein
MNLVVKVVKNRAGNMLFLLVRGPTLAEWALKVELPQASRNLFTTFTICLYYRIMITISHILQRTRSRSTPPQ